MRTTVLCLALALLSQTPASRPPQTPSPPVTFKVEVNYVEIDANVTDAQGHFVRTLTRNDFQLMEDGTPQALTAFSMVDIPIEHVDPPLFSKAEIPPDVVSNRTPFEGRVFLLVIDDLHTAFSHTPRTRAAAHQFVERYVGANDIVAVVNTSGYGKSIQDFTGNRQLILKAIDNSMGNKADSSTQAALQDYNMNQNSRGAKTTMNASSNEMQRFNNARNAMRTLKNLSDFMAGMRGRRKALVYFSEGINYDVGNPIGNPHASDVQQEIRDLISAATRANVSIYSVDPRGVVSGMEDAITIGSFADDNSITSLDLSNELRLEQDSLRVVADETGGFAVLNQNDFRTGFSRILEDNSSYYVLGYYPTNDKHDGRFRNVQVKVLTPGLTVHARNGYAAPSAVTKKEPPAKDSPAEHTSPDLRDALESPVPMSGVTLTAFAAPFRGAGANDNIDLSIEIDGSTLQFTNTPDNLFADDLEITLFATDASGKVKGGAHDAIGLKLKPQTHDIVSRGSFRVVRRIQVPPGKYQLKVGARESGAGRVGTVIDDLDAPDFSKGPLTMSGIAIASGAGSQVPTVNPEPGVDDFKDVLPAPPSAMREFSSRDTLALFTEVYDNMGSTAHRVSITASVLADDGKVVFTTSDERQSAELKGAAGGGYGYTAKIPLTGIAAGRYVLRVDGKSTLGSTPPVTREIEFRVR